MPFPTTNVSLDDPDVRIFFEGLLILSPGKENQIDFCEVTVVAPHHAHHGVGHQLTVDVFEDTSHPTPLVARLVGPLKQQLNISSKKQGVKAFVSPGDDASFDLTLDLKDLDSGSELDSKRRHTIRLYEGQLRSVRLSGESVSRRPLDSTNGCEDIGRFATMVETRIQLDSQALHLEMGQNDVCELSPGVKYVIYIRNSRQVSLTPLGTRSDFWHYYHEPGLKVPGKKWDIYFENCGQVGPLDTTRIPCMSVLYDGL